MATKNDHELSRLAAELEPWFGKPLAELPSTLRQIVNFKNWDEQDEMQRRESFSAYCNYKNQPTSEADLKIAAAFRSELLAAQQNVAKWERVATLTATDLKLQEDELTRHRHLLVTLENERDRGDYLMPDGKHELIKPPSLISNRNVLKNRHFFLEAEIREAMEKALDRDDPNSVWAALGQLAETKTGAMIGFSSDGVQYRGKKYQESGVPDVFTLKSLRARMRRARGRG